MLAILKILEMVLSGDAANEVQRDLLLAVRGGRTEDQEHIHRGPAHALAHSSGGQPASAHRESFK